MSGGSVAVHLGTHSQGFRQIVRFERQAFAAKIRLTRAVLDWSQTELGRQVGLTQRAIHKLEQGDTEPRRATVRALEEVWREQRIEFEDLADGGLEMRIPASVLDPPVAIRSRHNRS